MRLLDNYKQNWQGSLNNSSVLDMFRIFKSDFGYEEYLDIHPRECRFYVSRLRLSVLPLRIQLGRYSQNNLPRNERYCLCCGNVDIEDEYHFVFICPCYNTIRRKYLKCFYYVRPSVYKYHQLLRSSNRVEFINLSVYIKESLIVRTSLLNNIR